MPADPTLPCVEECFSHGADYPPANGKIRRTPCKSCAFTNDPETVRPAHISLAELEAETAFYDDFLCHAPDANGEVYTCACWAARFGEDSPDVQAKTVETADS